MAVKILTENTAAYCGQSNYTARAMRDGVEVGHLDYVVFKGKPSVSYIEVPPPRRQGVGRELLQYLQGQFPDQEIDFGMRSEEGDALINAITRTEAVVEVALMRQELAEVRRELGVLNARNDVLFGVTDRSSADLQVYRNWIAEVSDRWNDCHDREYELETVLERGGGLSDTRTMVIIDPPDACNDTPRPRDTPRG